jgi:hypothetical protein
MAFGSGKSSQIQNLIHTTAANIPKNSLGALIFTIDSTNLCSYVDQPITAITEGTDQMYLVVAHRGTTYQIYVYNSNLSSWAIVNAKSTADAATIVSSNIKKLGVNFMYHLLTDSNLSIQSVTAIQYTLNSDGESFNATVVPACTKTPSPPKTTCPGGNLVAGKCIPISKGGGGVPVPPPSPPSAPMVSSPATNWVMIGMIVGIAVLVLIVIIIVLVHHSRKKRAMSRQMYAGLEY